MLSTLVKRGIVVFSIILVSFLLLEFSVRLIIPSNKWRFHDAREDWQADSEIGWVQKANIRDYHFKTNSDGLVPETATRDKKNPKLKRILIFGDSTVVGRILAPEETLRLQLEKKLNEKGVDVEVFSAAVEGFATTQSYLWMQKIIPLYNPDIVLHAICQNDFTGNLLAFEHGFKKPLASINKDGSLHWEYPGSQEVSLGSPNGIRSLLRSSVVATIIGRSIAGFKNRKTLGKDTVMEAEYYFKPETLLSLDWKLFSALLFGMKQIAMQNHAHFAFFLTPSTEEVWEESIKNVISAYHLKPEQYDRYAIEKKIQSIALENKIEFIPLISGFLPDQKNGPFHLIPYDRHPNAHGYALEAEILSDALVKAAFF